MKRFNLQQTSAQLKIDLRIRFFLGEASFQPNANIAPGTVIPVLLKDKNNKKYLHAMKWGIDIFENGGKLTHNARSEKIESNNAWSPLIQNNQRCVIICRGFYFWHNTEIIDVAKRRKTTDRQPYYVSPDRVTEGPFFYIAALYKKTKTYGKISFSAVAITHSSEHDDKFIGYVQRIPLLLRAKDISNWLDPNQSIANTLNNKQQIATNSFQKIGLWVDSPSLYKDERICLQSRFEWDLEKEAMNTFDESLSFEFGDICSFKLNYFFYDFLCFSEIEKEALKQNEAKKMGIKYNAKSSWDHLKGQGADDLDLKQAETENINGSRKRTRFTFTDDHNFDDDDDEPPNKKQRVNESHDESLSDCSNTSLTHKKPKRRHSLESPSKKKVSKRRLSAN